LRFDAQFDRVEREICMFAKISLTAAFLLMVAPPIACASNRDAASPASMTRQANQHPREMVVAQDAQPNLGTSENDNNNDNDSTDSADDQQDNGDNGADQQNADGNDQSIQIPPTVLGAPDPGAAPQVPQMNAYPQPMNPYQQ
jgi:hypothetical protein